MASLAAALGLSAATATKVPNLAPAFIAWQYVWAYLLLSSRTFKQIYGIDHNESPRQDLAKYGDAAVKAGKLTQKQLAQIQRTENASANSMENFAFYAAVLVLSTVAGVDRVLINRAGLVYTVARIAYGFIYVIVDHPKWSQTRGVTYWIGNVANFYLLWQSFKALSA